MKKLFLTFLFLATLPAYAISIAAPHAATPHAAAPAHVAAPASAIHISPPVSVSPTIKPATEAPPAKPVQVEAKSNTPKYTYQPVSNNKEKPIEKPIAAQVKQPVQEVKVINRTTYIDNTVHQPSTTYVPIVVPVNSGHVSQPSNNTVVANNSSNNNSNNSTDDEPGIINIILAAITIVALFLFIIADETERSVIKKAVKMRIGYYKYIKTGKLKNYSIEMEEDYLWAKNTLALLDKHIDSINHLDNLSEINGALKEAGFIKEAKKAKNKLNDFIENHRKPENYKEYVRFIDAANSYPYDRLNRNIYENLLTQVFINQ